MGVPPACGGMLAVLLGACGPAPSAPPTSSATGISSIPSPVPTAVVPAVQPPDLSRYPAVRPDDYLVTRQGYGTQAFFRTRSGLTCVVHNVVGCDGELTGTRVPANEVDVSGFSMTDEPNYKAPEGITPRELAVGQKLVFTGVECAATTETTTICTMGEPGSPPSTWFVLSPTHSEVGPPISGLPENFPDRLDFVALDTHVFSEGMGRKGLFPFFTVANGLTCSIQIFSGGSFGCAGPLPGGATEISAGRGGQSYGNPGTGAPIKRLPAQHRITTTYEGGATCMATVDGGVACYRGQQGNLVGFVVTATAAWKFG